MDEKQWQWSEPPAYDEPPPSDTTLVFRNSAGEPIAVPTEIVTQGERALRCYQMRVQGLTWDDIAGQEGYPSGAQAKYDVERYLAEAQALVVENSQRTMLTLEVMRLDALQSAFWPKATQDRDLNAAKFCLDVIKTRSTLIGVDAKEAGQAAGVATTVVVPGNTSEEYVATMQRVAAKAAPPRFESEEDPSGE